MNKMKGWIVGLSIVSLLGVGLAVMAGHGLGKNSAQMSQQATGDCVSGTCDGECARALDGSGNGEACGYRQHLSSTRPLDGSGYHAGQAGGQGTRTNSRSCGGSCS